MEIISASISIRYKGTAGHPVGVRLSIPLGFGADVRLELTKLADRAITAAETDNRIATRPLSMGALDGSEDVFDPRD